jgi:hypothetical protein
MTVATLNLDEVVERVLRDGPVRVVTSVEEGCVAFAEAPALAEQKGVYAEVVYIRDDGWTLGAEDSDESAAERLYRGEWIARLCLRSGRLTVL